MSILIKMEMPARCDDCKLCKHIPIGEYDINVECIPLNRLANDKGRRKDCPLIELPPHGRLIDADALHIQLIDKELDQLQPWTSFDDYREVVQMIDDAPTIIEAEREE